LTLISLVSLFFLLATDYTDFTEDSQLCVLDTTNSPNMICAIGKYLRPQELIALL
jgi:hypothetical protein